MRKLLIVLILLNISCESSSCEDCELYVVSYGIINSLNQPIKVRFEGDSIYDLALQPKDTSTIWNAIFSGVTAPCIGYFNMYPFNNSFPFDVDIIKFVYNENEIQSHTRCSSPTSCTYSAFNPYLRLNDINYFRIDSASLCL